MFKIGEKVVCIDNTPRNILCVEFGLIYPKINEIYTVRGFTQSGEAIFLEEIINKPMPVKDMGMVEIGFILNRFRKLDHQFAEDLCQQLSKEVQQENYQLC